MSSSPSWSPAPSADDSPRSVSVDDEKRAARRFSLARVVRTPRWVRRHGDARVERSICYCCLRGFAEIKREANALRRQRGLPVYRKRRRGGVMLLPNVVALCRWVRRVSRYPGLRLER